MPAIFQSIAPLVLIILAGLIVGRLGLLSAPFRKALSDYCYYFGMPALLVRTIASAPPSETAPHLVWGSYLIPAAIVWIMATLYADQRGRSIKEAAAFAMASAYGNVIMLGIPLAFTQFGPGSATTVAFIVLVHSPALFLAAAMHTALAEVRRPPQATSPTSAGLPAAHTVTNGSFVGHIYRALHEVCRDLATNPIILAIFIGFLLRVAGIGLDPISSASLALLGQATLPCVLLAMGLSLSTFALRGDTGVIAVMSCLKLLVMPALAWIVSTRIFQLPAVEVAVITLLSAMPIGANAYAFASRVASAEASVSGAVALSTIASIITVTTVLACLGS